MIIILTVTKRTFIIIKLRNREMLRLCNNVTEMYLCRFECGVIEVIELIVYKMQIAQLFFCNCTNCYRQNFVRYAYERLEA